MNVKSAIKYGIINWVGILIVSYLLNPLRLENFAEINILIPISIIISTTLIGILYIRTIDYNETINGLKGGVIFFLIDMGLDLIFIIAPNLNKIFFENYTIHIISSLILIPLILTILGYLAEMPIKLK